MSTTHASIDPVDEQTIQSATPCCGTPVSLALRTFVRQGAQRRGDSSVVVWNLRCDSCQQWWRVLMGLRYRRSTEFGCVTLRQRAIGPIDWSEQ